MDLHGPAVNAASVCCGAAPGSLHQISNAQHTATTSRRTIVQTPLVSGSPKARRPVSVSIWIVLLAFVATAFASGCTTQAPTIAHVHIGHAITAIDTTPGNKGYFVLAEEYNNAALSLASAAKNRAKDIQAVKADLAALNDLVNKRPNLPFTEALREAARHIRFASVMPDASSNVRLQGERFAVSVETVLSRNNLINLYINDATLSTSREEIADLADEIYVLAAANVSGQDLDGDGTIGNTNGEIGMRQLRRDVDRMVAAENPPYTTVEQWYLFNLVRLQDGHWIFRRGAQGTAKGY